jgi:hypothetical protein
VKRTLTLVILVALLAMCVQMALMFLPYIMGTIRISNDYMGISGETRLGGRYVKNGDAAAQANVSPGPSGADTEASRMSGTSGEAIASTSKASRLAQFQQFLTSNRLELEYQSQAGWIMHHHNTLLAPVNEYALGKKATEINHQYGWLNTLALKHLMTLTGGVTLHNYFRVLYSFYPIYYALFLALAFLILRNPWYVLLTAALSFAFLNRLNYVHILLAPGFNPVRQLSWLFVTGFLFLYLRNDRRVYLLCTLLFSLVAILSNKEFGAFLVAALVTSLALRMVHERKGLLTGDLGCVAGAVLCALALLLFGQIGKNPIGHYYLKGISGPPMGPVTLSAIIVALTICYGYFLLVIRLREPLKYLAFFLFIYCQGILTYYVWNSAPNHFYSIATPIILAVVLLVKLGISGRAEGKAGARVLAGATLAAVLFLYIPAVYDYVQEKRMYESIFANRKVYAWDLPAASIKTTMDPKPLAEASRLIQRYSGGSNAIYLISKYDNILPFLARKYSAMPFSEVATSLLTPVEVQLCVDTIEHKQPQYLFVDTDLAENARSGGIDRNHPIYRLLSEHFDIGPKVSMLGELARVFLGIESLYRPVERGELISVFQRVAP